jgi:flagellar basal-body rod modification protein FlgD
MDTVSSVAKASDIQMNYMKLLVVQLQNQNPLEPLDNQEMASQLAQFTQLQNLETMNSNFAKVLYSVERSYASSLIGKEVSFLAQTQEGVTESHSGKVEQVYYNDDEILLAVGDEVIGLEDVFSVRD